MSNARRFVNYSLKIGALEIVPEGKELKSKRLSPYFLNSGKFTTGESMLVLAEVYADSLHNIDFEIVYGPPYKGTLLAPSVATSLYKRHGMRTAWSSSRKEKKDHADKGVMLGADLSGKRVLIVDDVITNGDTKAEAIDLVRRQGGEVVGIGIAFDRMESIVEGGSSAAQIFTKEHGVPVYSVADLDDLVSILREDVKIGVRPPAHLELVLSYRARYGAKY